MKKIVYLAKTSRESFEKGVLDKIKAEQDALKKIGYNVRVYTFSIFGKKTEIDDFEHITVESKEQLSLFERAKNHYKLIRVIYDTVKSEKPDFIYLRDCFFYFNLHSLLAKIAPVFLEIQTDVLNETQNTNIKKYFLERLLKRRYLRSVSGLIPVTNDILLNEVTYNKKPAMVLGNGINDNEIKFLPKKEYDNHINLIFIGSPGIQWHGVDRLVESFNKATNKEKFILHIVGIENYHGNRNKNIKFYGFLSDKAEIDKIFLKADIGIGTLALFKKGMNEAAPLKVRHYMAKGLPVILGYKDVDLNDDLPFLLQVPNEEIAIDFGEIEKFYIRTKELRCDGSISKFSYENLTWNKKMKNVVEFMESIIDIDKH